MFSLNKMAYMACNDEEKAWYDDLETPKIDIQPCCLYAMEYVKKLSEAHADNIPRIPKFWGNEAAYSGHVDCLSFAFARGYPKLPSLYIQAQFSNKPEILEFLRASGIENISIEDLVKRITSRYYDNVADPHKSQK